MSVLILKHYNVSTMSSAGMELVKVCFMLNAGCNGVQVNRLGLEWTDF